MLLNRFWKKDGAMKGRGGTEIKWEKEREGGRQRERGRGREREEGEEVCIA